MWKTVFQRKQKNFFFSFSLNKQTKKKKKKTYLVKLGEKKCRLKLFWEFDFEQMFCSILALLRLKRRLIPPTSRKHMQACKHNLRGSKKEVWLHVNSHKSTSVK